MRTQIKTSQPITESRGDRSSPPVHDAADMTTTQPSGAVNPTIQKVRDPMVQLVRQGVDISLRSLQVWADLARQFGLTALGSSATPTHDLFKKILAAQREIVDELVTAQRQFAQGLLHPPTVGDGNSFP
ncbi:MAG: hypothetical protein LC721_11020 [Actinobacteria bacterium]|nr:hypothetical protein [Actinomycetota bacterium]